MLSSFPQARSEAKAQVGNPGVMQQRHWIPAFAGMTQYSDTLQLPEKVGLLERLIMRFADIAERARQEYAPQHIANYLINLAGAFNAFYGTSVIIDAKEPLSPYRIQLTKAFLKNHDRWFVATWASKCRGGCEQQAVEMFITIIYDCARCSVP